MANDQKTASDQKTGKKPRRKMLLAMSLALLVALMLMAIFATNVGKVKAPAQQNDAAKVLPAAS